MEKIIEQVKSWPYLQQLPAEHAGFSLSLDLCEGGCQYAVFSYQNRQEHRAFSVVYDATTKDFLGRVTIGLTEYYDVAFIVTSLDGLEKVLAAKLGDTLDNLAGHCQYESIFRAKKILEWPYGAELPGEVDGFRLFISPRQPVPIINGSYTIIDYSDFAAASNVNIFYNVYRDEFFGQYCLNTTPYTTGLFDARELGELTGKLDNNLQPLLAELRQRIIKQKGDKTS